MCDRKKTMERLPIYFLNNDRPSTRLKDAFASIPEKTFRPTWVYDQQIDEIISDSELEGKSSPVIVIDSFDGESFYKLKDDKRIQLMSAFALMKIAPSKPSDIPYYLHPIESLCMRGLRITISGLEKDYKKIYQMIRRMGGIVVKKGELHSKQTTHIVALNWYSKVVQYVRHHFEKMKHVPVLLPKWISMCYEKREEIENAGEEEIIKPFRLPLFHQMHISSTGFDAKEKLNMQKIVDKNGGNYSPALILPNSSQKCSTHLVVNHPKGLKYERAVKESPDIFIVRVAWLLHSSHQKTVPCPEVPYSVKPSTELIAAKAAERVNHHEITVPTQLLVCPDSEISPRSVKMFKELKEILSKNYRRRIFENLIFYIAGTDSHFSKGASFLLRSCGGRVMDVLFSDVTHILLLESYTESDVQTVRKYEKKNSFKLKVDISWAIKCAESNQFFPEECCDDLLDVFENRRNGKRSIEISHLESEISPGAFRLGAMPPPLPKKLKIATPRRSSDDEYPIGWKNDKYRN